MVLPLPGEWIAVLSSEIRRSRGWIGVGLNDDTDWAEIEELIIDSYCEIAPKTLVKQLSI